MCSTESVTCEIAVKLLEITLFKLLCIKICTTLKYMPYLNNYFRHIISISIWFSVSLFSFPNFIMFAWSSSQVVMNQSCFDGAFPELQSGQLTHYCGWSSLRGNQDLTSKENHRINSRSDSCTLTAKKLWKIGKKRGKNQEKERKIGKKLRKRRKIRKKRPKSGRFFHFAPPDK